MTYAGKTAKAICLTVKESRLVYVSGARILLPIVFFCSIVVVL